MKKSGITDEMRIGLVSFEQEELGLNRESSSEIEKKKYHFNEEIIVKNSDSILTIEYFTEEIGCSTFKGGYKLIHETLTLYYQDVNFKPVKCIGFFKLEYKIRNMNLNYKKIKAQSLAPIREGFHLKDYKR